jgi:hypothetical protein
MILSEINFFSLTMDGSTDDNVTGQETIFIRTCVQGKTKHMYGTNKNI